MDAIQKYHNKALEKEAKSIVAGPSFLQFLNKLFQIRISTGDIIQFDLRVAANTICYQQLGHGTR
ncbi:MAG: hypothetical protein JO297_19830 [Nitrososphaeraceae archaeon]|nr:hypothetical protein [Nitrososphaeraceae archaeon]